jgi:hypothetical protein
MLEASRLGMSVVNTKLKVTERHFSTFAFNEKQWYFVALTQTPARLPWAASEVCPHHALRSVMGWFNVVV